MKAVLLIALLLGVGQLSAAAQTVVPSTTVQPGEVLEYSDLKLEPDFTPGFLDDLKNAVGKEARTVLYVGRPIRPEDLGPPAVIERNQVVSLYFSIGGMNIKTEGRALDRASDGEVVRVINLASRTMVSGRADSAGSVWVSR